MSKIMTIYSNTQCEYIYILMSPLLLNTDWQSSLFMNVRIFFVLLLAVVASVVAVAYFLAFVIFLATQVTDPTRLTFDETKIEPNVRRTTVRCG